MEEDQKVKKNNLRAKSRLAEINAILSKHRAMSGMSPEKFRAILEDLGPTFIKMGQILSMRQDMLPEAYCEELKRLRVSAKPMAYETVKSIIEENIGRPFSEVFESLDVEPRGSASIAQVHCGVLQNGEEIVVKVQRPGAWETMERDIQLLRKAIFLLKPVDRYSPVHSADLSTIVEEMWRVAQQELDFETEAENLRRFYELNKGLKYVTCPKVYSEYSTSHVLIMEKINGIMISDLDTLREEGYDMRDLGEKLVYNYLKQVLDDGFFHADPHPGNILIRDGEIVWIDLGMMGTLTTQDRVLFSECMCALAAKDAYSLEQNVMAMSIPRGEVSESDLYSAIDRMTAQYTKAEMGDLDLSRFLRDLLEVAKENNIGMPDGITMLFRGIITIQGVVADVSPEVNVLDIISLRLRDMTNPMPSANDLYGTLYKLKRIADIPVQLANLTRMASLGHIKMRAEISANDKLLGRLSWMVHRIVTGLIIASAVIGSSIILSSNAAVQFSSIRTLGTVIFAASCILGIYLILRNILGGIH